MMIRPWQCLLVGAALAAVPAFGSRSHRAATAGHGKTARHLRHVAAVSHVILGQRGIDSERTREIQTALIGRNYLVGEATGEWNPETEAAMTRFQADNGWQTKLTPDSRALIKLGLGPNSTPAAANELDPSYSSAAPAATEANTLAAAHSILN